MLSKIVEYIKHPSNIFIFLQNRCNFKVLPDKQYLRICYKLTFGKKLDFDNPQTFNEKLQWLKLYDRNPKYTTMVDKYEVKKYISDLIGEEYVIPALGVWDHVEDIDFDALPNQFVLKCTHDSGSVVICRDKASFDVNAAKKKISKSLKYNYYYSSREWPYKDVKPRVIAEKYVEDTPGEALQDLKFFCFNGVPKIMYVSRDKADKPTTDFFDMDFHHINLRMRDENADIPYIKPPEFEEMRKIAEKLSDAIPHLRVDFYIVNGHVYVGELTFYHCSGFAPIYPEEWNYKLGEWITISQR